MTLLLWVGLLAPGQCILRRPSDSGKRKKDESAWNQVIGAPFFADRSVARQHAEPLPPLVTSRIVSFLEEPKRFVKAQRKVHLNEWDDKKGGFILREFPAGQEFEYFSETKLKTWPQGNRVRTPQTIRALFNHYLGDVYEKPPAAHVPQKSQPQTQPQPHAGKV